MTARDKLLFWVVGQVIRRLCRGSPNGGADAAIGERLLLAAQIEAAKKESAGDWNATAAAG